MNFDKTEELESECLCVATLSSPPIDWRRPRLNWPKRINNLLQIKEEER
jgi:hypothetical protein